MSQHPQNTIDTATQPQVDRRKFLTTAGFAGLGVAAASLAAAPAQAQTAAGGQDTLTEVLTAVLVAEDLATTFYYNALIGKVMQDPALAGPGGTAVNVSANGNEGNVQYIRAALSEEISHADLARALLGGSPAKDPYQTFYFPAGSFDTLAAFTGLLDALENAFIGAYLVAIQELCYAAAVAGATGTYKDSDGKGYTAQQLGYFAKVAASIMGVEAEHRVLGRVISNSNPANNRNYQQVDGLSAVYNGPNSAVAALTPFLTPSTGPGYSLATALENQSAVSLPVSGAPPAV